MAEDIHETSPDSPSSEKTAVSADYVAVSADYDEFEVGEHKVPWFLWVFFILIVSWASIAWIQFFGY
jgi:hypothetical protein